VQRDMELVRKIVFALEAHPSGFAPRGLKIDGYTDEQVGYHVHLMAQAELLLGSDVTCMGSSSPQAIPTSLTWQGHEFAALARSDTLWKKATETMRQQVGAVALSVLTALLSSLASRAVGLP
jgi:Hypothetical protein (DUF2513)